MSSLSLIPPLKGEGGERSSPSGVTLRDDREFPHPARIALVAMLATLPAKRGGIRKRPRLPRAVRRSMIGRLKTGRGEHLHK